MNLKTTNVSGIYQKALQNGDISWYGKFRDPITKKSDRKKLGTKKKDGIKDAKTALLRLNEYLEQRKSFNNDTIEQPVAYQNYLTLNDLAKKYFDSRIALKKRKLREQYQHLTEAEFENYQVVKDKLYNVQNEVNRFNANVACFDISRLNVNKITKLHIEEFLDKNLYQKNLSQKSKFLVIALIKTIVNHAIKKDIVSIKNPFDHVKFKNPNRQRDRALTEEEIALLLKECKKRQNNPNIYLSVYLAVLTAGRANTILNIRKKDIDTKNGFISLYNFKSDRKYRLTLPDAAVKWLENKILPDYHNDEFLIRPVRKSLRTNPPQPMHEIPKPVYDIMDELFNQDLNKRNNYDRDSVVNFHSIRRSIATNLAKSGSSIFLIMEFLNHSNTEQTMRYLNMQSNELHTNVNQLMRTIFKDF